MDAEDWGELTGQIGFEIILEVATVGGAAALTTLKVANKTVDAARALEKLDDLADTAKGLEKIDDVGDGLKIADEVGDVFHYVDEADDILDPSGTYRDIHGRLKDSKTNRYVKDPKTVKFNRSMSERKKALMRDALDPNSGLSDRARKQILDSNGKNVPKGYEVDHTKPLYTKKTIEGKKSLDKARNMKTIRKSLHKKLHTPCNKVKYHKFPPNKY